MVLTEGAGSPKSNLPRDGGGKGGGVFRGRRQIPPQAQSSVGAENSAVVAFYLRRKRRRDGDSAVANKPAKKTKPTHVGYLDGPTCWALCPF